VQPTDSVRPIVLLRADTTSTPVRQVATVISGPVATERQLSTSLARARRVPVSNRSVSRIENLRRVQRVS
jgi:hypothetical protein